MGLPHAPSFTIQLKPAFAHACTSSSRSWCFGIYKQQGRALSRTCVRAQYSAALEGSCATEHGRARAGGSRGSRNARG